jgi:hypothetical protein
MYNPEKLVTKDTQDQKKNQNKKKNNTGQYVFDTTIRNQT